VRRHVDDDALPAGGRWHGTARREPWWQRIRSGMNARIEARRRRRAYTAPRPPSIRRALWRIHDRRALQRRRDDYLLRIEPGRDGSTVTGSPARAVRPRSTARDALVVVIVATACTLYMLVVLASVLSGDRAPAGSILAPPRAAAPTPGVTDPTGSAPADVSGTSAGFYRGAGFRFWHPSGWTVSEAGRTRVLESPRSDVTATFAPAPPGSLEGIAEATLADLEAEHGQIERLPADLTFAGRRSLAIGGRAVDEQGSISRFVVVAVTGSTGNGAITFTFAPEAAPLTYATTLQRILDSFSMTSSRDLG
jgi:hypothetical protein